MTLIPQSHPQWTIGGHLVHREQESIVICSTFQDYQFSSFRQDRALLIIKGHLLSKNHAKHSCAFFPKLVVSQIPTVSPIILLAEDQRACLIEARNQNWPLLQNTWMSF